MFVFSMFGTLAFADAASDNAAKIKALQPSLESAKSQMNFDLSNYNDATADYAPLELEYDQLEAAIKKGHDTKNADLYTSSIEKQVEIANDYAEAKSLYELAKKEYEASKKKYDDLQAQVDAYKYEVKSAQDAKDKDQAAKDAAKAAAEELDARRGTLLPETQFEDIKDCEAVMFFVTNHREDAKTTVAKRTPLIDVPNGPSNVTSSDILACGIKTGNIKLWMVPFYIRFVLEFVIGISGLVTVGAVIYGGYLYLFAGVSDDKDKGKNALKNGIIGLILTLTAWGIVNVVMALVTI